MSTHSGISIRTLVAAALLAVRSDGAPMYQAASGNIYADEGNHWDVTFYTCGC